LKLSLFIPSQKLLDWLQSQASIKQLHQSIYINWILTDDKSIQNPNQSFQTYKGSATSYHWFLAYCLWKRFKSRVYLVELYRFVWKFPFIETCVVVLKKNKDFTFSVFNSSDIYIIHKLSDLTALLKFPHLKSIYHIPTNQKVNL